ncbi:hypothetical protein EDD37DRAFT_609648 [Exophiala viscosa]|uniref:uncharacterized protein n=1 Tax=Exophiala viscosa TaxID=2486360 RepID=UPI00218F5FBB|nr:hypothetical protein EDD37DRAFT_609648 [Exophiala viscosa]
MPHYRDFADEWPEYADEWSDVDESVRKKRKIEEKSRHERTPAPMPEEPIAAGGDRSSTTASANELSGLPTSSYKSSVTSDPTSLNGMLLEGLSEYAGGGKHKQERRRDNPPEWIEISDDEDDVAVKEEPTQSNIEADLDHQPLASDTSYPDASLMALYPSSGRRGPGRPAFFPFDPAGPTVCIVCHQSFAHRCSMLRHYKKAHPRRHGLCTTCGLQFDRRSRLESHLRVCGPITERTESTLVIPEPYEKMPRMLEAQCP